MSNSFSQNFSSTQNISQEATEQKKLTKFAARYIELEQLRILTIIKDISAIIACTLSSHTIVPL
jgi:hypothetical protein